MISFPVPLRMGLAIACLFFTATAGGAQSPPDTQPPIPPNSCACGPQAVCESAVVITLEGERAALELIAGLPGPLAAPALFDLSSDFHKIGRTLTELRSFQQYATLPVPLPLPARELIARSLQSVATLPVPLPYPVRRTMPVVTNIPGPLPYPTRDTIQSYAELIADLPLPFPQPVALAISRSLQDIANIPGPLPEPGRQILRISASLVANMPGPLPEPAQQQLLTLTQQVLKLSVMEQLTLIEQKIGTTPEAAPLGAVHARLRLVVMTLIPPLPCPLCDAQ